MMIATIDLEDMEFYAYHGCYAEEKRVGNRFIVNLQLRVECARAAETDNVADALNYVEAYNAVADEMRQTSNILENVASRIAARLRRDFGQRGLVGGTVRVAKMAPPVGGAMRCVAVTVEV